MEFIDTHCHIHDSEFAEKSQFSQLEIINRASEVGVKKLICVGTSLNSSVEAFELAQENENCYFSIALHPHEAEKYSLDELKQQMHKIIEILKEKPKRFVAVGECGLDYFYHSDRKVLVKQQLLFKLHLDLATKLQVPLIFHVRDAFDDFFRILDEYDSVEGVVHSFSASTSELDKIVNRGLYVGLNGIMTFTKDEKQLEAARKVPVDKLLIETDSPFLTPRPFRGTINEPKLVTNITKFIGELRGESQAFLAKQTTKNAKQLFKL
jgi:TatD DNase family protein